MRLQPCRQHTQALIFACVRTHMAGKFNRHIDIWDAVTNQEYFSLEAFQHVLAQLASVQRVPDLPGPAYTILRKWKDCEVRRWGLSCSFRDLPPLPCSRVSPVYPAAVSLPPAMQRSILCNVPPDLPPVGSRSACCFD